MPLVENPVRCHGLSVLDNTTGVILENGGVIVLLSPAFPDTMVNEIYEMLFPVLQYLGRDLHVLDAPSLIEPCSQHNRVEPDTRTWQIMYCPEAM